MGLINERAQLVSTLEQSIIKGILAPPRNAGIGLGRRPGDQRVGSDGCSNGSAAWWDESYESEDVLQSEPVFYFSFFNLPHS